MTEENTTRQDEAPTLDDVMDTREQAVPDHHEHAKQPKHLNDGELERRTEIERDEVGQHRSPDSQGS